MAGIGPPPNPQALRRQRESAAGMLKLPESGRPGPAPKFPLTSATAEERALWRELWALPQAVAWERFRYGREIALYVRWQIGAESGDKDAAREARLLSDRLGLNPAALLRLKWSIVPDDRTSAGQASAVSGNVTDIRTKVRAVDAVEGSD